MAPAAGFWYCTPPTANHLGLLAGRAPVHPDRDLVQRSPSGTVLLLLLLLLLMRRATPNFERENLLGVRTPSYL